MSPKLEKFLLTKIAKYGRRITLHIAGGNCTPRIRELDQKGRGWWFSLDSTKPLTAIKEEWVREWNVLSCWSTQRIKSLEDGLKRMADYDLEYGLKVRGVYLDDKRIWPRVAKRKAVSK